MLKLDLLFPVLPPMLDGIGDHTAKLAQALEGHAEVRVLTALEAWDPIPGVGVRKAFTYPPRRGVLEIADAVQADPPDWLFVQFNQFSYGRWGLNPFLPVALWLVKRRIPELHIAVMFHEDFLPANTWKNAIMTTWQRAQFWALGMLADHVFFSIDPWVKQYRGWFPRTPVDHLPVGSNMPYVPVERSTIRKELNIGQDTFVMGVFGSLHASRLLGHIRAAAEAVMRETEDAVLLYIGPHGTAFKRSMEGLPVLDAGRLPAEDVSRHFQAMDVHLAPFIDGVSTRRGSFMAGIQHGIPSVGTLGPLSDHVLQELHGEALVVSPVEDARAYARAVLSLWRDPAMAKKIGAYGKILYQEQFAFDRVAHRLHSRLSETS